MTRNRGWILLIFLLAGCSTHPLVDICDFFQPGKLYKTTVNPPYGGVAIPQGPIIPAAPNISIGPPGALPAGPVIPPPQALPGNRPGVQLQTPTPGADFPAPPPLPGKLP